MVMDMLSISILNSEEARDGKTLLNYLVPPIANIDVENTA